MNMAQPQQTQTQKPANQNAQHAPGGGKPANPAKTIKDPKERSIANLQYTLDRACNFIHDGQSSVARRIRTAARAGVPKDTATKALNALRGALADAEKAAEAAYTAPNQPAPQKSRVTL